LWQAAEDESSEEEEMNHVSQIDSAEEIDEEEDGDEEEDDDPESDSVDDEAPQLVESAETASQPEPSSSSKINRYLHFIFGRSLSN
jgi:hypothetical protein